MKVHFRADEANGVHTKFTVFMNGANCGQLTMSEDEACYFHEVFVRSTYLMPEDEFMSSCKWFKE